MDKKKTHFSIFLANKKCVNWIGDKLNCVSKVTTSFALNITNNAYISCDPTLANIYTAMQVSRKLGNLIKYLDDFWLKYLLTDSLKIFLIWKPFRKTIKYLKRLI